MRLVRGSLCILLLTLGLVVPCVHAQCPGMTVQQTPYATEELEIDATVKGFTAAIYKPSGITPSMALLTIEGGTIRYVVVGTPSPIVGHPVGGTPAQTMTICGLDSIAAFRATRITTTSATIRVTFYKAKSP